MVALNCVECAKLVEQLKRHAARDHMADRVGTQGSMADAAVAAAASVEAAASVMALAQNDSSVAAAPFGGEPRPVKRSTKVVDDVDQCAYCSEGEVNKGVLVGCDHCDAWFHPACAEYKKPLLEDPVYDGHSIALHAYCSGCLAELGLTTADIDAQQEEFLALERFFRANSKRYRWHPVAQDGRCSLNSAWERLPLQLQQQQGNNFETFVRAIANDAVERVKLSEELEETKVEYIGLFKKLAKTPRLLAELWPRLEASYLYLALTKRVFPSVCLKLYALREDGQDLQPFLTYGDGQDRICLLQWNRRVAAHFDALDVVCWTFEASRNGILSNNGHTFTKATRAGWDCATRGSVCWSSGVHEWAIRIDTFAGGVSMGISQAAIETIDIARNTTIRYDIFCGSGCAVGPDDVERPCFEGSLLKEGSVVSLRLDMDTKALTFGLDGEWMAQPTFTGIASGTWYPYFAFCRKGCTVSIVPEAD